MTSDTNTALATLEEPDEDSRAAVFLKRQLLETDPNMDAGLRRVLAGLGATMAKKSITQAKPEPERQTATEPVPQPKPAAQSIQLPIWPESVRGAPNSFLRSALFAAIQGKSRRYLEKAFLGSLQGVSVRFTGKQLDQWALP